MRVVLGIVAAVLLLTAPAADAARVRVDGGTPVRITACAAPHAARLLDPGATATVRARGRLVLEQCRNGSWAGRQPLGRRRAAVSRTVGDFRVRAPGRRPAFLRFGVGEIVDVPFAVPVDNVNRTSVACAADGAPRILRGRLVGPRTALDDPAPAVSLLVHGFGHTRSFWRFRAVPGYDTQAALAAGRHVTVAIDRAGYGASRTAVDGTATCLGSQADMVGQVAAALRNGDYALRGGRPVRFHRLAVVGHSAGGLIAEIAAATFDGIDGLGILGYADQGQSPRALEQLAAQMVACAEGATYAPFGATDSDFRRAHLNAPTDPAVADAVLAARVPDPCGDPASFAATLLAAQPLLPAIEGPVLLLSGSDDALFLDPGVRAQAARLNAADTVTTELIPDTGHALTLGRSAPTVRNALESWLSANEF